MRKLRGTDDIFIDFWSYIFRIWAYFRYIPQNRVASLEKETFPAMLEKGEKMNGYYEDAYWADVGTITDFERVDKELLSRFYAETGMEASKWNSATGPRFAFVMLRKFPYIIE